MTLEIIPTNVLIVFQRIKKRLLLFNNVWKPQLVYKFSQLLDLNHTRFFQMKSMTKDLVLLRRQRLNVAKNLKTLCVQIRGFVDKNNIKDEIPRTCRLQISCCNIPYSSEEFSQRTVCAMY